MGTILFESSSSVRGTANFAIIDATSEEDIARQMAEDDAEAAKDAIAYAARRDKIVGNLAGNKNASLEEPTEI